MLILGVYIDMKDSDFKGEVKRLTEPYIGKNKEGFVFQFVENVEDATFVICLASELDNDFAPDHHKLYAIFCWERDDAKKFVKINTVAFASNAWVDGYRDFLEGMPFPLYTYGIIKRSSDELKKMIETLRGALKTKRACF